LLTFVHHHHLLLLLAHLVSPSHLHLQLDRDPANDRADLARVVQVVLAWFRSSITQHSTLSEDVGGKCRSRTGTLEGGMTILCVSERVGSGGLERSREFETSLDENDT